MTEKGDHLMAGKAISIKTSLLGSAIAAAAIILLIGAIGVLSMRRMAAADRGLFEKNTVPISHLLSLDESFQRARINVRDYVLSKTQEDRENYRKKITDFRAKMQDEAAAYETSITTTGNRDLFEAWKAADKEYAASEQEAMGLADAGHPDDALELLMGSKRTLAQSAADSLGKLAELNVLSARNTANSNTALSSSMARIAAAIGAAGILVSLLLSVLISLSIVRRVGQGVQFAEQIASGDLTRQLSVRRHDEVGRLVDALNRMASKLKAVVTTISESAIQVASSSEQITASAQKLAEGTQNQASTLEQTSASVEELTASVEQVSEHAQSQAAAVEEGSSSMAEVSRSIEEVSRNLAEISGLVAKSVGNAQEGTEAVIQVVAGINQIAASSEKIGGIVTVIADIADQTNLLALNAAIEAARAGEHGRGFAVVAEEVSKLADRSASSTKEIEALIKESVRNVTNGVQTAKGSQAAMEQITAASQKVQEMIGGLSDSMHQQVASVKELTAALQSVSEMSQSISAATEEQTTNAKQVSAAVENVNEVTQSAASSAEEMSASTEQLAGMALELQKMTSQFRITGKEADDPAKGRQSRSGGDSEPAPGSESPFVPALVSRGGSGESVSTTVLIDKAIGAHGAWKQKLTDAAEGRSGTLKVETVRVDDKCEFGKWLYSLPGSVRATETGKRVRSLHADFHKAAADVLELALAGRKEEAHASLARGSTFALVSSRLTTLMMEWKRSLAS
jgi:methyl-accepting chemotaxis protein